MLESTLKKIRKSKGYSQQGMAEKVGIPVATYNLYEHGKRGIPAEIAQRIASILGFETKEIFLCKSFTVSKT